MSNEVGGTFPTGSKTIRNGRLDFHHETLAGRCGSVPFTNPDRSGTRGAPAGNRRPGQSSLRITSPKWTSRCAP
jgi:hypothetical protein